MLSAYRTQKGPYHSFESDSTFQTMVAKKFKHQEEYRKHDADFANLGKQIGIGVSLQAVLACAGLIGICISLAIHFLS